MKPSQYNHAWKSDDETVYFNAMSGALEIIRGKVREWVDDLLAGRRSFDNDLLQTHLAGLVQRLYSSGYLVDSARDEFVDLRNTYYRNKHGTDCRQWEVGIAPSLACNFDCQYCYAAVKRGALMSRATEDLLLRRLTAFADEKRLTQINISWIGGEPLTNPATMRRLSEALYRHCDTHDCRLTSSLVTNGSLLTDELAMELSGPPYNIRYLQITLDALWHDRSRPFAHGGEGSLAATTAGLRRAAQHLPGRVWVRVNVPYPHGQNEDVIDFLLDYQRANGFDGGVSFYFAPVQPISDNARLGVSEGWPPLEWAETVRRLNTGLARRKNRRHQPGMPERRHMPCGYETHNNVCIDPEGFVYKCWHHIGTEEKAIGHINFPLAAEHYSGPTYERWRAWSPFDTDLCRECKSLPLCMGMCFDYAFELGENEKGRCLRNRFTLQKDSFDQIEVVLNQRAIQCGRDCPGSLSCDGGNYCQPGNGGDSNPLPSEAKG